MYKDERTQRAENYLICRFAQEMGWPIDYHSGLATTEHDCAEYYLKRNSWCLTSALHDYRVDLRLCGK